MAHLFESDSSWQALAPEAKLDAVHADIRKLFGLIEELNHKDHMLVDAVKLLQARLDDQARVQRASDRV